MISRFVLLSGLTAVSCLELSQMNILSVSMLLPAVLHTKTQIAIIQNIYANNTKDYFM